ncbi:Uncharacterised protein family (UPF0233) [Bifidobacterium bohemicum]|uniref:Cell division protein CrgA n=1 Tax=Bifidobacterium bohemicum DSM 22767 TaxID=1437606 RepID=A0A086ZE37_9BIFI|nr:cell division protein CrgA [Bifidobacterium bohemicum]KFI44787.1 hypothetical protein BBOH_1514 [Bifidobacterium bohemicum DSM 22767]SCC19749.1 Uncharacterised protein family (UPF0233) [Bifidobacterium bohemicum]
MADEELDENTNAGARDDEAQAAETTASEKTETETAQTAEHAADKTSDDGNDAEQTVNGDDDDLDLPMDQIEALLSADQIDKKSMSPQMRRVAQRQAENAKRVEETIKDTKTSPKWFVPVFCALMIIGLFWAVIYYFTSKYPIPGIGAWNLAIALAIAMVGFLMTIGWH